MPAKRLEWHLIERNCLEGLELEKLEWKEQKPGQKTQKAS